MWAANVPMDFSSAILIYTFVFFIFAGVFFVVFDVNSLCICRKDLLHFLNSDFCGVVAGCGWRPPPNGLLGRARLSSSVEDRIVTYPPLLPTCGFVFLYLCICACTNVQGPYCYILITFHTFKPHYFHSLLLSFTPIYTQTIKSISFYALYNMYIVGIEFRNSPGISNL